MKKLSLKFYFLVLLFCQIGLAGLYRYGYIESKLVTLIPAILIGLIILVVSIIFYITYKYINSGNNK